MLYPQNGDRVVPVDFVTSFHPMYRHTFVPYGTSIGAAVLAGFAVRQDGGGGGGDESLSAVSVVEPNLPGV